LFSPRRTWNFLLGRHRPLEELTGRLDGLQFGLELFDPSAGGEKGIGLVTLEARCLSGIDQRLAPPLVEGDIVDAEFSA
jgi:hypothetical protein